MTEEEARKKWCPHMRVNGNNRNYSVTEPESDRFRCIASDCMMWESYGMGGGDCGLKRISE